MCERGASQMLVSGVLCVFKCGTVSFFITFIVSDRCARTFGPYRYLFPVFFYHSVEFLKLRSHYPLQQSRILVEKIVQYDPCVLLWC